MIVAAIRTIHADSSTKGALQQLKDLAVTPEQPELYKEAVKIYNPAYACEHPAFVTFPNNTEDIKRCLQIAAKTGISVAIKSGGHCFAGYSTTDSKGFVISMKNMNRVQLKGSMVTVQAGATWGDVYSALDNTNYVAVGGCVPAVGIGGYILGGGYSMLSRGCGGLACDKAVSFSMVTADGGKLVQASNRENSDLFWALKGGGGGNFGVLVDVTLEVCPRPNRFIWRRLIYDSAEDSEKGFNAVAKNLDNFPKELNLDMAIHGYFGKKSLSLDAVYSDIHEVKDFHFYLLVQGSAPLSFLEESIREYVQCTKDSKLEGCYEVLNPVVPDEEKVTEFVGVIGEEMYEQPERLPIVSYM